MIKNKTELAIDDVSEQFSNVIQTVSGPVQVRWDQTNESTPMGQLAYFIEYLHLTNRWLSWVESCPLFYTSPNSPSKEDVLGTLLLCVLAGHKRYAHATAIRGDTVNPSLLGMRKVISEDSLRNAMKKIPEKEGISWLDEHLLASVLPLLDMAWILDVDTTIKTLYGKQEGAEVGYNPKKPGRASHAYHSYFMSNLRLVLGVEVCAGNQHTAMHAQPGLLRLLDALPPELLPHIVRGDNAFGNNPWMSELEARNQNFLFKLRQTKNVQRYIISLFNHDTWKDAGQGWEGLDGELSLNGWEHKRRVIVLRRPIKKEFDEKKDKKKNKEQLTLPFIDAPRKYIDALKRYEYAVLVTNTDYEIFSIGQLYRDRADAENAFDELKGQWAWGGYTTRDLHRCQLVARAVGLIYNWWSLFVRLANPGARREAITSRPWLMTAIGCKTEHAGQTCITLTGLHANFKDARTRLLLVSAMLQSWFSEITEELKQCKPSSVWKKVCDYLKEVLASGDIKKTRQLALNSC